jgi:hypothetical protein
MFLVVYLHISNSENIYITVNISPWSQEPLQLKAQMGEEAMAQAGMAKVETA